MMAKVQYKTKHKVVSNKRLLSTAILLGVSISNCFAAPSLASLRGNYQTSIQVAPTMQMPLPKPPAALFDSVRYDSDGMSLAAFVTPDPNDGDKHPAIVWITGGESNTLADFWRKGSKQNDQTASPYRDAA